jgi:phosphate transport system substrate-binding protein
MNVFTRADRRWMAGLIGSAMALSLAAPTSVSAAPRTEASPTSVSLLETGSTLLYPLFEEWAPAYHHLRPAVTITPSGTGSGTGIADAENGSVQIGASDAYMSDAQVSANPGILNIPLAISAQVVAYNLPGLNGTHLHLSGAILAGIYTGRITNWDAPALRRANPGVKLPHHAIIPVRRNDSSGDSFLFTQYMTLSAPKLWTAGYATAPNWPAVSREQSATGNGGMVEALASTPYTVAYVGISYLNQLEKDHMGYAALGNRAGHYVLPTEGNIIAAAKAMVPSTPKDERVSLIYAPGPQSYPIINYEYAVVRQTQSDATVAGAVKAFLLWAIAPNGGNQAKFLNAVHFLPLPPSVHALSRDQINRIHG